MKSLALIAALMASTAFGETAWCPPDDPAMSETIWTRDGGFEYWRIGNRHTEHVAVECIWEDRAVLLAKCTERQLIITDGLGGEDAPAPGWFRTYVQRLIRFEEREPALTVQFSPDHPRRTFTRCE